QPVKNKEIKSRNRYLLVNKTGLYIDNNFVGTITLLNDVTEKREHEEKMKHASTLSVMGELAAATAHEIKNPLTTIQGFIQFFMQQPAKKVCEVNSHLELLLDEIERINKIITDFLKLARPEQPKLAHINTEKLLKNTLQLFEKEATYRNLNLQWKQEENLPEIYGDPDQIKQVLLNLIQNAFQACSSGGQIKFTADSANNSLIVNVEDDGIGISDDVQRKLFQPFFTTKEMGTGLGLPISQRIIEEHGGEIKVDRSSLGGARFTIKLPFHNNNTIKER
ncbi:MAG: hypothetical protein GX982_07525, partial [Tissierellia bacterium]|nr:hypothetical protein [Tissierellia bacterium]